MNLAEKTKQIAKLKAEGAELARAGKLEEAEAKKAEINQIESAFEAEKTAHAEEMALEKGTDVNARFKEERKLGEENKTIGAVADVASVEYKNAFLKQISGRADQMTALENTAFTHTTQNTPAPLPTTMLNEIWDLVSKTHTIVGDVTTYRTGTILEVVKHTAIVKGAGTKQAKTAEGTAPVDDEQNTIVKVTLSGNDFVKAIELSYAEAEMSIDALEAYLVSEIASSIGDAIANDMVATIKAGVNAGNKKTTAAVGKATYEEICGAFASLQKAKTPAVYCTRATLYNRLATLTDGDGRLIFQPNATEGIQGYLLGAPIKIEDSVADNELLIGDPKQVVNNVVSDIMVETDKDIKAHKYIYSGYERSECALINDKSFAVLTVKTA
ncbi:phage major capsid protein [Shuttleworthella satelles]|uniref:Phage major capsid protein, HK97 family n=1 Tax=Shuttleworthella satelles DSM 14600 TaxID=626523 RepID=C4GAS4_9FIRM|nr:phage major capsid protein [Shuttleworthia satelles]EEP28217.1 phage major capsid protein, HK97 family [Shuttleworthia satelles DSM 14600]